MMPARNKVSQRRVGAVNVQNNCDNLGEMAGVGSEVIQTSTSTRGAQEANFHEDVTLIIEDGENYAKKSNTNVNLQGNANLYAVQTPIAKRQLELIEKAINYIDEVIDCDSDSFDSSDEITGEEVCFSSSSSEDESDSEFGDSNCDCDCGQCDLTDSESTSGSNSDCSCQCGADSIDSEETDDTNGSYSTDDSAMSEYTLNSD